MDGPASREGGIVVGTQQLSDHLVLITAPPQNVTFQFHENTSGRALGNDCGSRSGKRWEKARNVL